MPYLKCLSFFALIVSFGFSGYAQRLPIESRNENFRAQDLIQGVSSTMAQCSALQDAVWAKVDSENAECIRYWRAGFTHSEVVTHALIYVPGDQLINDQPDPGYTSRSPKTMQELANQMQERLGVPFILISTPGTFGSSGEHKQRRRPLESRLISAAIDEIKYSNSISTLTLVGLSGGGHIVASLLGWRSDVACAVLASAVSSPKMRWRSFGLAADLTGYADSYEPAEHFDRVSIHPNLRVFILGDRMDSNVPWATQLPFALQLKSNGVNVEIFNGVGGGAQRHALGESGRLLGSQCMLGKSLIEMRKLEGVGLKG